MDRLCSRETGERRAGRLKPSGEAPREREANERGPWPDDGRRGFRRFALDRRARSALRVLPGGLRIVEVRERRVVDLNFDPVRERFGVTDRRVALERLEEERLLLEAARRDGGPELI